MADVVEPRFREKYQKEIVPALMKRFGYKNLMQVPRIKKVVVNMGLGEAVGNPKLIDAAVVELAAITGQKPVVTRAKKSIASFKLREGMPIGARVTLRGERMWLFMEKLISVAVPRIRDFQGLNPKGFDRRGNYNMGLSEQSIFPDIDLDKVKEVQGMNISFTITGGSDDMSRELLMGLGMPLKKLPAKKGSAA